MCVGGGFVSMPPPGSSDGTEKPSAGEGDDQDSASEVFGDVQHLLVVLNKSTAYLTRAN